LRVYLVHCAEKIPVIILTRVTHHVIVDNEDSRKDIVVEHQSVLPSVWRFGIQRKFDSLTCVSEVNEKARQIIKDCFLRARALVEEEIGKAYISDSEAEELNLQPRFLHPLGARKKGDKTKRKRSILNVKNKMSKARAKTIHKENLYSRGVISLLIMVLRNFLGFLKLFIIFYAFYS